MKNNSFSLVALSFLILFMFIVPHNSCFTEPPPERTAIDTEPLSKGLQSADEKERLNALVKFDYSIYHEPVIVEDIKSTAFLIGMVINDPSRAVRIQAMITLGNVLCHEPIKMQYIDHVITNTYPKSKKLFENVLKAYQDEDEEMQVATIKTLGCFHSPTAYNILLHRIKDKNPKIRISAIRGIERAERKLFLPVLVKAISDENIDVQEAAIDVAFGELRMDEKYRVALTPATKPLLNILGNKKHPLRQEAAWALGRMQSKDAIILLSSSLYDSGMEERSAVALNHIGNQEALDILLKGLKSNSAKVRSVCVYASGGMDSKYDNQTDKPLLSALKDKDKEVLLNAITVFITRSERGKDVSEAVPSIIDILKHSDPVLRRRAATALGYLGDKRAIEPLKALLKDSDEYVRNAAGKALWYLGVKDTGWDSTDEIHRGEN